MGPSYSAESVANMRRQVLGFLYFRRMDEYKEGYVNGKWVGTSEIREACFQREPTGVEFAVSVLCELGHIQRDGHLGFGYRITAAGVLAFEATE